MASAMQSLGRYIRERRQERGLTIREVAAAVGYAEGYLGQLERGALDRIGRGPGVRRELLDALSRVLDVPRDELYILAGYVPETRQQEFLEAVRKEAVARREAVEAAFDKVRSDPDFGFGARGWPERMPLEAKEEVVRLYERVRGVKLLPES